MGLGQSAVAAGSYTATNEAIRRQANRQMQAMRPGGAVQGTAVPGFRRQALAFAQSEGLNNTLNGAGFGLAAYGGILHSKGEEIIFIW